MKIVVYAGAFNPVTKGHFLYLQAAVEKTGADLGLFFERNDSSLHEKTLKNGDPFILSKETRREMLMSLAEENPKLQYGGVEPGKLTELMPKVQKKYGNATLYYLTGADKLHGMLRWEDDSFQGKIIPNL